MTVPTKAEVAEIATQIYQTNILDSNLVRKAEESALGVENLYRKVATTKELIVGCSRVVS